MAITFTHAIENDLLLVSTSGFDGSVEDVAKYGMGVLGLCLESGCLGILCDERSLEYRVGILDLHELAEYAAEVVPRTLAVAIVPNAAGIEDAMFYENVAVNRGIQVKAFTDVDQARHWLEMRTRAAG
jgi:hypothetical protein